MLMGPDYEEQHEKWVQEVERQKRAQDDEWLREYLVAELEAVEKRLEGRSEGMVVVGEEL